MRKVSIKKLMATAVITGAVGVSAAPLSASAHSGGSGQNSSYNTLMSTNREVNRREARAIAQEIFPQRTIDSVNRRNDGGVWEFRVRFTDGTRVDVRQSNGRVTFVRSSRSVNERQAERIAEAVFPRKTVRNVVLRTNGDDVYRVRFTDSSRVDVRVWDGMIVNVVNGNV